MTSIFYSLSICIQAVPPPVPPPPPPGLPVDGVVLILILGAVVYGSWIIWRKSKKKDIKRNNKTENRYTIVARQSARQIIK